MITQLIQENRIPEFGERIVSIVSACGVAMCGNACDLVLMMLHITLDNFYLDMNGIIHNCSHPSDGDAHFRITEEQIFLAIFAYIDHLFGKIKPKKLFCAHILGFCFCAAILTLRPTCQLWLLTALHPVPR
jgi:5'-3' exonuclease